MIVVELQSIRAEGKVGAGVKEERIADTLKPEGRLEHYLFPHCCAP